MPWHRRHNKVRDLATVIVFAMIGIMVVVAVGTVVHIVSPQLQIR